MDNPSSRFWNRSHMGFVFCILALSFAISVGGVKVAEADITTGLVGHWTLDSVDTTWGVASTTNDVVGTNHGTPVNFYSSTSTISGKVNQALKFDGGDDRVTFSTTSITNFAAANSVCVWINSSNIAFGTIQSAFSMYQNSSNSAKIYIGTSGGNFSVGYKSANTGYGVYKTGAVTSGDWVHGCYVWNGTAISLYINGTLATSNGSASSYAGANAIGSAGGASQFWLGSVDDVRVYNRALDDADVLEIYNLGVPVNSVPDISLGSALTITYPNTATLAALVTDDALPEGSSISSIWSKISGPGTVSFASTTNAVTDAAFSEAGTYVIRLTATDSDLTTTADVTITVLPQEFSLRTLISGTGSGTISGTGISCTTGYGEGLDDCTQDYDSADTVTLTATADSGSTFVGWTGGGCSGTNATCNASIMTATTTVTAIFDDSDGTLNTYYVDNQDPGASDSNPGTEEEPWLTINKATSTVVAGDRVIVKAGTYNEYIKMGTSGTASNPIIFEGERDANGNWLTIIDPSTDASTGWVAAPEIGAGVWKKDVGFNTREMVIDNKRVAFVYTMGDMADALNNAYDNSGLTTGAELLALSATSTMSVSSNVIGFWDGMESLWGASSNTTYLRFRYGEDPNGMNIRVAKITSAVDTNSKNYLNLRNFKVRGAYTDIYVNGSNNIFIENNFLSDGYTRVSISNGAYENIVRNNVMTTDYYGYSDPGAHDLSEYRFKIRNYLYNIAKYLMGVSASLDDSIRLDGTGSSNNVIYGNHIFKGLGVGIAVSGDMIAPTQNTDIYSNTIENHPSIGIILSEGHTSTKVHDNVLSDNNIGVRFHKIDMFGETSRIMYLYRNKFWNPSGIGDQIYFHFNNTTPDIYHPEFWIYHNSVSGGALALSVSGYAYDSGGLPNLRVINNIFSGSPYVGNAGSDFMSGQNMVGIFDYNLVTPNFPTYDPAIWFNVNNVRSGAAIWSLTTIPDYIISSGSDAEDAGLDLSQSFTIDSTTYDALPGMSSSYFGGSSPDMGAYEIYTGPTISSEAASSLSGTSGTLNGNVSASGGKSITQHGFAWGTSSILQGGDTATTTLGTKSSTGTFTSALSSLTCATTYYARAYATNSAGTGYGSIVSFTTSACAEPEPVAPASSSNSSGGTRHDLVQLSDGSYVPRTLGSTQPGTTASTQVPAYTPSTYSTIIQPGDPGTTEPSDATTPDSTLSPIYTPPSILTTLPSEFLDLVKKFPSLGKTLGNIVVRSGEDVLDTLKSARLSLPNLSRESGSSGIPISSLSPLQKESLPGEVIFARSGDLIDYNVSLTVSDEGTAEQVIHTIAGKPIDLALKPDKPVKSITGYLTVKNIKRNQAMRAIPANSLLTASIGSLLAQNTEEAPVIDEKLVLSEFSYSDPDSDGIYTASINAPMIHGEYDIMTIMEYKDDKLGAKEFHLTAVVDPEGYVYTAGKDGDTRLENAKVTLWWKNSKNGAYEIWPAVNYKQTNPQLTDRTGSYSFLVPPGTYKISVSAPKFYDHDGAEFEVVQGSGIHENIELTKKSWWRNLFKFLGL